MTTNYPSIEPPVTEIREQIFTGKGARFWAYVSPENQTDTRITHWKIEIRQRNGEWSDVITSDHPDYHPQTPDLSGIFTVIVTASGPDFKERRLLPAPNSNPNIGCNANCAGMIGIVASPDGRNAHYWTVWDAICRMKD